MSSITILDYSSGTVEIIYVPDNFNQNKLEDFITQELNYRLSDIHYMYTTSLQTSSRIIDVCDNYLK